MARRGRPRKNAVKEHAFEKAQPRINVDDDVSLKTVQLKLLVSAKMILDEAATATNHTLSDLVNLAIGHADKSGFFTNLDLVEPLHVKRARAIIEKWRASQGGRAPAAVAAASRKKDQIHPGQGTLKFNDENF